MAAAAGPEEEGLESLYSILEVNRDASAGEIRKKFQSLIRKYHPDRLDSDVGDSERENATNLFHKVTKAYNILSDTSKKLDYDKRFDAQSMTQKWPVSDVLDLDDMNFDPTEEQYESPCRCGGKYVVMVSDLEEGVEVVCCSTCSLSIRVLYQEQVLD